MRSSSAALFLSLILIILASLAYGWTEPRPLTDNVIAFEPQAISQGRNIYLVTWPVGHFHFMRSTNNGYTWSYPSQPADSFYRSSEQPDIKYTSNGLLHVVWIGYFENDIDPQIFHQSSSDGGRNWSNRHRVFIYDGRQLSYPRLATNGDTLFLAYKDVYHLRFYRSFDNGLTWQNWTTIDTAGQMLYRPSILFSQGRLHIVYEIEPDSITGTEIYYKYSDDAGLTWSQRIALSTIEHWPLVAHSQWPSAYADNTGHLFIAWYDFKYGIGCGWDGDILTRVSTDNGDSWLPEARLTYTHTAIASSCLIVNGTLFVAWTDNHLVDCSHAKIMYSRSSNWGADWSNPELITGSSRLDELAPFLLSSISGNDTSVHCFYAVADSSIIDIFYVRNKSFLSNHAPIPGPNPIILDIKAYPNVFNSSTQISFYNENGGETDIEIFNLLGQRIWHRTLSGKEGDISWDAEDDNGNGISSGTYFVRATNNTAIVTTKLLYLK